MNSKDRILLVEDEEKHADLFFEALEDMEVSPDMYWVTNSTMALEAVDESFHHLAIVDIALNESELDGLALTKEIKKRSPETRICVFSISDSEADKQAAKAAGADIFLTKPLSYYKIFPKMEEMFALIK
ncbi:MAG: response regulator [Bacteroidota bacterium]